MFLIVRFLRPLFPAVLFLLLAFFATPSLAEKMDPVFGPSAGTPDLEVQYSRFPKPLPLYADEGLTLKEQLVKRAKADPFNVVASIIFVLAILHTFAAGFFHKLSVKAEKAHHAKLSASRLLSTGDVNKPKEVSFKATVYEFLGEVEAVFAIWGIPLLLAGLYFHGWGDVKRFIAKDANFTEPLFVVVIMAVAATKPVIWLAERALARVASLGGGTPSAWWLTLLICAPLLGSLITEPAAMTIAALLLSKKFYELNPSIGLKYATLGLLFVNVSIGGVLTNFAAPPVLMVAGPERWNWSSAEMLQTYGLKAVLAVVLNAAIYWLWFRKELSTMKAEAASTKAEDKEGMPAWIVVVHLLVLCWTVFVAHYPPLFVGGFLFFLAFCQATASYQDHLRLRGPIMVGFFLAGLVLHGKLQGWWLEPILSSGLNPWGLHLGSAFLTSFNDNALITFLASQVPDLSDQAKYAIMSGAVAGGGLTVIANAPNPAGQSLLKGYFPDQGVSPMRLLKAALLPTGIAILFFMLLR